MGPEEAIHRFKHVLTPGGKRFFHVKDETYPLSRGGVLSQWLKRGMVWREAISLFHGRASSDRSRVYIHRRPWQALVLRYGICHVGFKCNWPMIQRNSHPDRKGCRPLWSKAICLTYPQL